MSHDNPNQCGYYEEETVPCDLCGTPTPMTGTRRCNPCWELERRVEQRPEVAKKLVAAMDAVTNPDTTTQLITRLTEALAETTRNLDEMISTVTRAVSQCQANATVMMPASGESIRRAREALAAVAKERAL